MTWAFYWNDFNLFWVAQKSSKAKSSFLKWTFLRRSAFWFAEWNYHFTRHFILRLFSMSSKASPKRIAKGQKYFSHFHFFLKFSSFTCFTTTKYVSIQAIHWNVIYTIMICGNMLTSTTLFFRTFHWKMHESI